MEAEYFNWESADRRFMVHMHLDAIDGLARDVIESAEGIAAEVGGLLLGQVGRGDRPVVWIERYQRVEIERKSTPDYVLETADHVAFERSARLLSANSELTVVGFYRTQLRPGLQLEDSDLDLAARYFRDPEDLLLLLKAEQPHRIQARFFGRDRDRGGKIDALGPAFPFRGRLIEPDDPEERTAKTVPAANPPVAQRRLVPDFGPEPRASRESSVDPAAAELPEDDAHGFLANKWPLIAAVLVVAVVVALVWQQALKRSAPQPARVTEAAPARPLGLYVDPSGPAWRISWNPSATGLQGARTVKLFVRDGDEPSHVFEMTPPDLQAGSYQYAPKNHDVMFRLEVTDAAGRVSAESFRLINSPPPSSAPATSEAPAPPKAGPITQARVSHRVAPVVPTSIRPRLHGSTPVDVRVKIDTQGRVTSAIPVVKPHTNLDTFLAARAVYAAKQWRFEPARQNGHPIPASQIIHFVFEK
ncbi:MAG TPA: energy transducer TonB [Bryobacteraceae bacterium]|nr:energy transducer TonB [Bryobacteraceae bacterium]